METFVMLKVFVGYFLGIVGETPKKDGEWIEYSKSR